MKLDKKSSALETELAYLSPRERVDADEVLKDDNSHVDNGQVQIDTLVVLQDNRRVTAATE